MSSVIRQIEVQEARDRHKLMALLLINALFVIIDIIEIIHA